ncbi:MAG: DTW domain-containing protein [Chitinispirillaceae bacterium]|nr:DTW domain-containing protein [Chitinispirillaceae bacterium]
MSHCAASIDPRAKQKFERSSVCNRCLRPKSSCFCSLVPSLDTRLKVIILQHPQEQYKKLNSARLAHLLLKKSVLFTGLSWPNFKKIAGPNELPSQWGVLYLRTNEKKNNTPLSVINRKKQPLTNLSFLRGIIAIDGTWKQAKTLWWRNPWLTRLNQIHLNPSHAAHASVRPQVKAEGLSTIESIACALEHLGENAQTVETMNRLYQELIIAQDT